MTLEEFLVRAGVVQENPAAVAVVATIRVMAPPQLIQAVMAGIGCLVPHIFAKVLELPFTTDVDISVKEGTAALRFVAATDGFSPTGVCAHTVETHPGITKVVVRDLSAGPGADDGAVGFKLDRWRFCLPARAPPWPPRPTKPRAKKKEREETLIMLRRTWCQTSNG
jgi:hypothetical protein